MKSVFYKTCLEAINQYDPMNIPIKVNSLFFCTLICTYVLLVCGCNGSIYIADFMNAKGYVIGKEICHTDETKDSWLIDLTVFSDTPQYGDTLVLAGTTYTNVVKVKTLSENLKRTGIKVSLDFNILTPITSATGCEVANPITYPLKELVIIKQGEIR
jgi:hypothetical protein